MLPVWKRMRDWESTKEFHSLMRIVILLMRIAILLSVLMRIVTLLNMPVTTIYLSTIHMSRCWNNYLTYNLML